MIEKVLFICLSAGRLKCSCYISRNNRYFSNKCIPMYGLSSHFSTFSGGDKRRKDQSEQLKRTGLPQILGEVIFGIHPVRLALTAKRRQPYRLYIKKNTSSEGVKEIRQLCREAGVTVTELQKNYLNILSENRPHQGVCLDASRLDLDFVSLEEENFSSITKTFVLKGATTEDDDQSICLLYDRNPTHHSVKSYTARYHHTPSTVSIFGIAYREYLKNEGNQPSFYLLPYMIRDPMNMGSILRSAYFFGVDCVVMPKHDSSPLTPMVSKASSGVAEIMNIMTIASDKTALRFIQLWSSSGGSVIGTSCDLTDTRLRSLEEIAVTKPTLLLIGNEGEGLPGEILQHCDVNIHIQPHRSQHLDSLNVSVATEEVMMVYM